MLIRKIYTIGGFGGVERIQEIEVYDIVLNNWKLLNLKLTSGITNSAAISVSASKILIFGGGLVYKYARRVL